MPMPSAEALYNNIYFTHITSILPFDGVMIPGSRGVSGTRHPKLPITPDRFTLHWFPQTILEPHLGWEETADERFFIVEPAKHLRSTLYGGYAEDFMSLGPHQLSEDAVIFVPRNEIESILRSLYPGYKGQLVWYSNKEDVKKLIDDYISEKAPKFKLHIAQNQKNLVEIELDDLIHNVESMDMSTIDPLDAELLYIKRTIEKACLENPRPKMVTLEENIIVEDIKAKFNGNIVIARDFFSAWEKTGMFFGGHEDTLFKKLEISVKHCFSMAFQAPSMPLKEDPTKKIKTIVEQIKKELDRREFPSAVHQFFGQKIEIDLLEYWIPLLIKLSRSSDDVEIKIDQLAEMAVCATVLSMQQVRGTPLYEKAIIDKQPTARLLSEYTHTFFRAYKREQGLLVDALAIIDAPSSRIKVQNSLKQAGIPSYLSVDGQLVVPNINTPMVGHAARKSLGL